ncbi:hypothetical protein DYB38_001876 [Aphanomyces astaci]|uniref:HTH CENPB-type domain-containing protein n=1 Tax=Aphanomyces astaci TaxID=112090 RepID=A0A397DQ38_APHAT|nr:hypothetical protein DYB38_001876 [Aphanomyces astaci]
MPPRTPYTHDTLSLAVQAVLSEEHTVPSAASAYDIPQRTLRKHVSKAKSGVNTNDVTMGPSPLLPRMFEDDLATWVLVMARDGHPVGCREIKQKATQMLQRVHGIQHLPSLSTGWYSRFLGRHPDLKILKAQVLTKSRNSVDSTTIVEFVHQLAHSASLVNMDPTRIFNMDETSFSPSKKSKKVVVHKSTTSVHAEESTASTHVTIVACVGADGRKLPPLFVLPGQCVSTATCDSLTIPGAAVTTSEKGWTNSFICRKWLSMLDANIPSRTQRPILLIMDGCSSHFSEFIYAEAKALNILLQFLPANVTHLLQPLDVTVFRPFKQAIRHAVADSIWNDVPTNINKQRAVAIACDVWANSTSTAAIQNGFVCTGLCPLSLDKMMYRLSLFKPSALPSNELDDSWVQEIDMVRGEVRDKDLRKPQVKTSKKSSKKTLKVGGMFITSAYNELLQAQAAAKPKRKKKKTGQGEVALPVAPSDGNVVVECVV